MSNNFIIRPIQPGDEKATLEIYRPYVEDTIISFEYEAPSLAEWEKRITSYTEEYPWLVCEYNKELIGYAYGSKHRTRTAYSWSAESTIYMSDKFHRRGIARVLYETLFELLKLQGYVNVYAGVGLPNEKSEAFHLALGFYEVGTFKKIGYKFGGWHDTRWFQLHLTEHPGMPQQLKLLREVKGTEAFNTIIERANLKVNAGR